MANNFNSNGRKQQGSYDNVPPTQYLGGNGSYGQQQPPQQPNEDDPYGEGAYYDYDRPESFDVSYYTRGDGGDYNDNLYMSGGGNHSDAPSLLSPDGPMPPGPMMGELPPRKRRTGRNRDSDMDSVSDGGYSIRSSLVRTPASHGSNDIDIFGAYRNPTSTDIAAEDGRYASYAPSTES
ncbi:hypothetical protein IWW54_004071, partial [Coemansia sp. RSA 2705]